MQSVLHLEINNFAFYLISCEIYVNIIYVYDIYKCISFDNFDYVSRCIFDAHRYQLLINLLSISIWYVSISIQSVCSHLLIII